MGISSVLFGDGIISVFPSPTASHFLGNDIHIFFDAAHNNEYQNVDPFELSVLSATSIHTNVLMYVYN